MKNLLRARIVLGVTTLLALALVVGGLSITTAFAQGPSQGGNPPNVIHDNQAVLDLLQSTETELLQLRQSGKSWGEIASAKEVTETALLDALLQPMNERHAQMAQFYPLFNAAQMTELMRTQLTQDLSVTQFGTIADRHVFGGVGMMGNWHSNIPNGFGGMMHERGMMGNWNNITPNGFGGMMRGWNYAPNVTPVPSQ